MYRHIYTAYGLIIQSEIDLPELQKGNGQVDVTLRLGDVPDHLHSSKTYSAHIEFGENQFLLRLAHVARFWVKNGQQIVIQPAPGSEDSEVRLFLLGTCLGVLLHQRGILALHASAIETSRGAVLFTGPSGIGKSTAMAAFLKKGYRMLSDDVTGILLDKENRPIVLPAMPRTKLWADSARHLGHDLNTLPRLRSGEEKFGLAVPQQFAHNPVILSNIYQLSTSEIDVLEIKALDNLVGFQVLLNNTYREFYLDGREKRAAHIRMATRAAAYAQVSLVSRNKSLLRLDDMIELIEADFSS